MRIVAPATCTILLLAAGCTRDLIDQRMISPECRAVVQRAEELQESCGVEVRAATQLDGINTNVMRVEMRSADTTMEERIKRAQTVARWLADHNALPMGHQRIAFDFPVSFQVGCMPVSLYERIQLDTGDLGVIQALPAQRILVSDQVIRGRLGERVLDDAVWSIPFYVTVDRVELAREVMGVAARPDEVFVSVHALWTNIGTRAATMTDDPWRLVEYRDGVMGEAVAFLDGGDTHLARNKGAVKIPAMAGGEKQERWYVFRVKRDRLEKGIAFARQRFAKPVADPKWQKAGFELVVPLKSAHAPGAEPAPGAPLIATSEDWRTLQPAGDVAPVPAAATAAPRTVMLVAPKPATPAPAPAPVAPAATPPAAHP